MIYRKKPPPEHYTENWQRHFSSLPNLHPTPERRTEAERQSALKAGIERLGAQARRGISRKRKY